MKIPLIPLVVFCTSALQVSGVAQVSGHTGGELSVLCFSNWTTKGSTQQFNMYFCKGRCSKENRLVQTERTEPAATQRGRYNMKVSSTGFTVTIKRLKKSDAGSYYCNLERNGATWSQEVKVTVLEADTAPVRPVPHAMTVQTINSTLSQDNFSSSILSLTPMPAEDGSNKEAATSLTDTTIVIIVSVSLALLVCAIIPMIFYGHWRSTTENQNTAGANKADCCEDTGDVPLAQSAELLQTQDRETEAEASAQDSAQYASIYQALDPTTLE